jgi:hypothetical protein
MAIEPTLKATTPVGDAEPDAAVTVAVRVTIWPMTAGFGPAASVVVVATWPDAYEHTQRARASETNGMDGTGELLRFMVPPWE